MKKRVLALLLSACMVLGMAGCSSGKAETASDGGGGKASDAASEAAADAPDRKDLTLPACRS